MIKLEIPILICLYNSSDLDNHLNKMFLSFMKAFLERYGLLRNSIFVYGDEITKALLKENNIEDSNIFKTKVDTIINHHNYIKHIYYWLIDHDYDWYIYMEIDQIVKNINIMYESIKNIDDEYDFIGFSTYAKDISNLELDDNNKRKHFEHTIYTKLNKIFDKSFFVCKKDFFIRCCEISEFDEEKMNKEWWNGKYLVLDNIHEIEMNFTTIKQVDNFIIFYIKKNHKTSVCDMN